MNTELRDLFRVISLCEASVKDKNKLSLKRLIPKIPKILSSQDSQETLLRKIFTKELLNKISEEFKNTTRTGKFLPPNLILEVVSSEMRDIIDPVLRSNGFFNYFDSDLDLEKGLIKFIFGTRETKQSAIREDFRRLLKSYQFRKLRRYILNNFKKGSVIENNLKNFDNYILNRSVIPKVSKTLELDLNLLTGNIKNG